MLASHVHDAIGKVNRLQAFILERRLFKGFSGRMRMVAGGMALAGTVTLASDWVPATPYAQLAGWAVILFLAMLLNYGGLMAWFLFSPQAQRRFRNLTPALDAVPALGVGAVMSLVLVVRGEFDLLFGTWMCLYGLAHIPYRLSLPAANYWIGVFYMVAGAVCLLSPQVRFVDPWPMGIVFFTGETVGGYVLHQLNRQAVRRMEESP